MPLPTKGMIEAEVANAVVKFHKEQQGRGPTEVRAYLIGDMVLVRCNGILTPTEARLSGTEDGRKLIRSARQELRTINHTEIEETVASIVGCAVLRSYCDLNVTAEELIEVYILTSDVDARFGGSVRQPQYVPPKT